MTLENADGSAIDVPVGDAVCSANRADFFRSGAIECEALVCLRSATGACPGGGAPDPLQVRAYCSKACVSDRDCYSSETGLVCRAVVLDQEFLAALDPATRARYLGDIQISNYCAIPLP